MIFSGWGSSRLHLRACSGSAVASAGVLRHLAGGGGRQRLGPGGRLLGLRRSATGGKLIDWKLISWSAARVCHRRRGLRAPAKVSQLDLVIGLNYVVFLGCVSGLTWESIGTILANRSPERAATQKLRDWDPCTDLPFSVRFPRLSGDLRRSRCSASASASLPQHPAQHLAAAS